MAWNDKLTELNNILAELYPIKDQSYRILDMAGIPIGNIAFKDTAMDNWYYILKEASRRNKVEDLVQVVINQYPERTELKNIFVDATDKKPMQPIEKIYLNSLKSFLKEGELGNAIDQFDEIAKEISNDFHNNVILQSARYRRIRKDKLNGLVSDANYQLEINKINHALLQLIDEIPENVQINASRSVLKEEENSLATIDIEEFEKIIGKEELFEINWLQKAIKASKSVCKVMLSSGGSGTGFILNGGYLLTNHHVLETKEMARNAKIIFNYKVDEHGTPQPTEEYYLDESFFETSIFENLDYSLVKIKDDGSDLSSWGFLSIEKFLDPQEDERVNIIQHPEGKSLKIALPDKIISKWKQYLFYIADTKPGSSGSPVFNQDWKVIALHHAGINEQSEAGGMQINEQGDIKPSNRGILIKDILKDLQAKGVKDDIINQF